MMEYHCCRAVVIFAVFAFVLCSIVQKDENSYAFLPSAEQDALRIRREVDEMDANPACTNIGGACQDKFYHQCNGSYISGKCKGTENIKCCIQNITLQDSESCRNIAVYSRDSWGARNPVSYEPLFPVLPPLSLIFIHHTAGPSCTTAERCTEILRYMQDYHIGTNNWHDISDNFLIGEDGNVYEGRGWRRVGAHIRGYNRISLSFSVIGNFSRITPNRTVLDAVRSLLTCAVDDGYIQRKYSLYGHRDVTDTECPGEALYKDIMNWPHYNYSYAHDTTNTGTHLIVDSQTLTTWIITNAMLLSMYRFYI